MSFCNILGRYRFPWHSRRPLLAADASFNPPNLSSYPFSAAQVRARQAAGQMFLIDDGPGLDSVAMQSSLIDQFGLVYEPYDFYIPNMRGVGSSMDAGRVNLHEVPATTVVDCTSVAFDWRASVANSLPRCVSETNAKFGQWMTGISTRGYANDIIAIALSLDPVPPPPAAPRRLLYGRGYGGLVAEEIQTIMNCNSIYNGKRASLPCSWMNRGRASAAQEPYCGSSFFIVKDPSLTFDVHIMDGVRDFDRREPALWYHPTFPHCNFVTFCAGTRPPTTSATRPSAAAAPASTYSKTSLTKQRSTPSHCCGWAGAPMLSGPISPSRGSSPLPPSSPE